MDATTTNAMLTVFIGDVGGFLSSYLPYVLAVLAGLVGIGILFLYTKRHVVGGTGFKKTVYVKGLSQQKNGYISVDY